MSYFGAAYMTIGNTLSRGIGAATGGISSAYGVGVAKGAFGQFSSGLGAWGAAGPRCHRGWVVGGGSWVLS